MWKGLGVWAVFALGLPSPNAAQVTAIRAGRVLDPETGTTATRQVILVDGPRIRQIGPNVTIPAGAIVVDLSAYTVLPGLFDAHTHLCLTVKPEREGLNFFVTTVLDPTPYRAIEGVANARGMLEAGFTTVRDLGNAGDYADTQLRRAIEAGVVPGPTMLTAGRIIAPFGGQFQLHRENRSLGNPEYFYADTRDELLKAIRENVYFGATVLKIVIDDQRYLYSVEDLRFIIEEAARLGVKVAAHAYTGTGAHHAALAGVASIEHGQRLTDEDLALAKQNGVVLVGTDFQAIAYDTANRGLWVDRLRRAHRAGVTMAYGADVVHGIGRERGRLAITGIDPWVEAGIPTLALVRAMTANAARLLGVEKERGLLKAGMAADIIATPENPLDDVTTLKRVVFVMKEGQVIKVPANRGAGGAATRP
jgi:imidazolonepropionase-like amidohydrolase